MQKVFISLFLLLNTSIFGQTKPCDCSEPLKKDLTEQFTSTQYSNFKQFVITYFKSSKEERQKMKSDKSFSFSSVAQTIIEGFPLMDETKIDYKESDEKSYYYKLKQLFFENSDIKDEEFNQVISSKMSDNQLKAYLGCIQGCNSNLGVTYLASGELEDVFSLTVLFNAQKGGDSITLNGNAVYSNLKPLGGQVFVDKLIIKDRKSITGIFKRINPNKKATFTINTVDNVSGISVLEIPVNTIINPSIIPIGTIVSSILPYESFLKINGLDKIDNTNAAKAIWVPCDGRFISNSKYSQVGGPKSPDLRGVFLRGINDYGTFLVGTGIETLGDSKKNPEDKKAGEFQNDQIISHSHFAGQANVQLQPGNAWRQSTIVDGGLPDAIKAKTSYFGGSETRPKNVTIYYYIKIN